MVHRRLLAYRMKTLRSLRWSRANSINPTTSTRRSLDSRFETTLGGLRSLAVTSTWVKRSGEGWRTPLRRRREPLGPPLTQPASWG